MYYTIAGRDPAALRKINGRAGGNILPHIDKLLADTAIKRRGDGSALQIQPGSCQVCLGRAERGFGRSQVTNGVVTMQTMADDLVATAELVESGDGEAIAEAMATARSERLWCAAMNMMTVNGAMRAFRSACLRMTSRYGSPFSTAVRM